ncbi:MAG: sigma-70 family RNA polymerase sigma factor [Thermaerobacter sp.]|nr:sigma-70 family RNA polymerase sigma factor [Thermaerobacter sp.]
MSTEAPEAQPIDFDALVSKHQARLVSVAMRITGSWEAAEDCAQEAFLRLFFAVRAGDEIKRPGAWLSRVTTNLALDQVRRKANRTTTGFNAETEDGSLEWEPEDTREDTDPAESTARKAVADLVWRLSANLSPYHRVILSLRTKEQCDYDEIASRLGITPGNARVQFSRAKEALRQEVIRHLDRRAVVTPECRSTLTDLPRFLDHQLSEERRRAVVEHLRTCRACAMTETACRDFKFYIKRVPGSSMRQARRQTVQKNLGQSGASRAHPAGQPPIPHYAISGLASLAWCLTARGRTPGGVARTLNDMVDLTPPEIAQGLRDGLGFEPQVVAKALHGRDGLGLGVVEVAQALQSGLGLDAAAVAKALHGGLGLSVLTIRRVLRDDLGLATVEVVQALQDGLGRIPQRLLKHFGTEGRRKGE